MKDKMTRNKAAGLSMLLGIAYLIHSFSYYYGDISSSYVYVSMGAEVARILIFPHLLFALLAVCINIRAFIDNANRSILISAIFYVGAIALYPRATIFLLPEFILSLIAFFRMPEEYQTTGEIS